MKDDPVLARFYNGKKGRERVVFKVEGGLHYIRGNRAPYFSLTASGWDCGSEIGGCCHEMILKHFPDFADLAAMHLSDIDGSPSYAESNGWYHLAGALGGAGERYHVGNSERHFPVTPPADKPWANTEYRFPTQDECVQLFADYIRVPLEQAQAIVVDVQGKWNWPDMRTRWRTICEEQRPRWKREADACIAKHSLAVYGDPWEQVA